MARTRGAKDTKPRTRRSNKAEIPSAESTLGEAGSKPNYDPEAELRLMDRYCDRIMPLQKEVARITGQIRAIFKEAKGDGLKTGEVKMAIEIKNNPGGLLEKIKKYQSIFVWQHPNQQAELFGQVDASSAEERAFKDGKRAGLAGEACKPPRHFSVGVLAENWIAGWHAGQEELMKKGFKTKPDDDESADEGEGEPNADESDTPAEFATSTPEHEATQKIVGEMLN